MIYKYKIILYWSNADEADYLLFGRERYPDRRGFLKKAGLAVMGAMVGAAIPFHRNIPAHFIPVALASNDIIQGKDGLTVLNDRPLNAETPPHLLDDAITPTERHFIRNNGIPPENTDAVGWKLTIDGLVDNPLTLSIDDLKQHLERCGWEFFRVRESAFYANREVALEKLWPMLEERGIFPASASGGGKAEKAKVKKREKASTKPPFELTHESPNNHPKPRIDDGQGELDFEREDAEAGGSSAEYTKKNSKQKKKVWWTPVSEVLDGTDSYLWVMLPADTGTVTVDNYWGGIENRIEHLIEEVAKDPVGMTGCDTPRQAVQWLAQQTVGDVTLQDIWLEGDNPGQWAFEIVTFIQEGRGQAFCQIDMATNSEVTYRKVASREREWAEDPEEASLWTLLEGLMYRMWR